MENPRNRLRGFRSFSLAPVLKYAETSEAEPGTASARDPQFPGRETPLLYRRSGGNAERPGL